MNDGSVPSLEPNAWAYLNIHHPMCAWNVWRGVLASPLRQPGFLSVWMGALLKRYSDGNRGPLIREVALERVRAAHFPGQVSRMQALYCFEDLSSAERALVWGNDKNHFRPEYVASLYLDDRYIANRTRVDSNWITFAKLEGDGSFADTSWFTAYWSGTPRPNAKPAWETLLEGRLFILGMELRNIAYDLLRIKFPESLVAVETARLGAWAMYDYGNMSGFLQRVSNHTLAFNYALNVEDTNNEDFRRDVKALIDDPEVFLQQGDVVAQLRAGNFGRWPDLQPYGFQVPIEGLQPLLGL